jgi:hypothetical protein
MLSYRPEEVAMNVRTLPAMAGVGIALRTGCWHVGELTGGSW